MSEQPNHFISRVGLSETTRLEAFSDGVIAIAITLLILEIRVPHIDGSTEHLAEALWSMWPTFVAFLMGFSTIGIMWLNHHRLFTMIRKTDDWLLIHNMLLLLGITFINFPTALLGEYLGTPDASTAVAAYTATTIAIAIFYNLVWRHAVRAKLLDPAIPTQVIARINRAFLISPFLYGAAFVFSFLNVFVSLAIVLGQAIYYGLPQRRPVQTPDA